MNNNILDISGLAHIKSIATDFSNYENRYIYAYISAPARATHAITDIGSIDGFCIMIVKSGLGAIEVNTETFDVAPESLVIIGPNHFVKAVTNERQPLDVALLLISREFMYDINLDLNVINMKVLTFSHAPTVPVDSRACRMLRSMFESLHLAALEADGNPYTKSIARNLLAALFYELLNIGTRITAGSTLSASQSRRVAYVHKFLDLVSRHHCQERSVKYYAEKMFITPKYLSVLIREATGHSAVDWIDQYVILEAKNMLRYSGKNIQQIAYDLNFSNQSAFGKYFKNITGVSPSEFRHS
ncbi:MAG TPA: helix-turn-helix domain-containing protein [Muribaculum sp.]|jgi:AraC-like DNA-binding protein|uniref:Helix-turn-helix domain-containing protein n=1 Tax=Heminiphilus faecis TaxID=2601703 RepID=A0ABV4CV02_9BACT|nr:helix-turn-helix domain-containing protein [Heminiphilus faecis]RLT77845.1 AraC family transcriptional regulator [bacterium J10(2018)]DAT44852.1 MAG TPA: helix-turn-helix domain protein [Caudoviricetes sp.]HRF68886.1 helix-turn-helix domain-containing protein [Muribaculum sp.]